MPIALTLFFSKASTQVRHPHSHITTKALTLLVVLMELLMARLVCNWLQFWLLVYMGCCMCWLPLDYVSVISDAGKGTLFAYLANREASFTIMVTIRLVIIIRLLGIMI